MVKSNTVYKGQKHCQLTHEPSGSVIETDAPKDNQGLGQKFSPTDLVGAALGSCIMTTNAIVAERDGLSIEGSRCEVEKEMVVQPQRRIGSLSVVVTLPAALTDVVRKKLERVALQCPVHQSLHPDVQIPMRFQYE
jgi:putative redox protein